MKGRCEFILPNCMYNNWTTVFLGFRSNGLIRGLSLNDLHILSRFGDSCKG